MICGKKRLYGVIAISAGIGALFSLFITSGFIVGLLGVGAILLGIYFFKCCC